jgi:hypothetical protein
MDATLKAKIEGALRLACQPDPTPDIHLVDTDADRIGGSVISICFAGHTPSERQDRIWQKLDDALTPHERTRISFIVTDTPEEHDALAHTG